MIVFDCLRRSPAPSDYIETQTLATHGSRRKLASPLLLRINHVLIIAQSNGLNFPNADRSRFLTIPYGLYGNRSTGRLPAIDAGGDVTWMVDNATVYMPNHSKTVMHSTCEANNTNSLNGLKNDLEFEILS